MLWGPLWACTRGALHWMTKIWYSCPFSSVGVRVCHIFFQDAELGARALSDPPFDNICYTSFKVARSRVSFISYVFSHFSDAPKSSVFPTKKHTFLCTDLQFTYFLHSVCVAYRDLQGPRPNSLPPEGEDSNIRNF